MNDKDEISLYGDEKDYIHCICFCNSDTEKIPMWYLYAGITGKGASVGITPGEMVHLLSSIETVSSADGKTVLHKEKDFDLEFGWVFYRKKEEKAMVFYKNKWNFLTDPEAFETGNYFIKTYPWEYEKEFRIVIRNKTRTKYDYLVVDLSPVYSKIKVKLAPEITKEKFIELIPELIGFKKFFATTIQRSSLAINMNLCKRNYEAFIEYLAAEVKKAKEDREVDLNKMRSIVDCLSQDRE